MAKKLKILEVTPYFYPAWAYGGIPRVAYELSKEMARRGHEVTVCTTDALDSTSRHKEGSSVIDGINVHYFRNLSNSLAYNYQLFLPAGLTGFIRRNIGLIDIIHLHGHRHFLNNIVRHYALQRKKPYILSGHGTAVNIERMLFAKRVFDVFFGKSVLRDASGFIAVSEAERKQYEGMGIDKRKVSVIYNGIDCAAFERLPEKGVFRKKHGLEGRKIILFLGKITPRKGVDFLVRAFSGLNDRTSVLVIAGNDMGFKGRVVEIVRQMSLSERVIFTGLLTGEDKLSAYRDADVVVYPAVFEIFGLVPFEAMMCGTPVIVTDDCGCGEIIGREEIGYTVRYNDLRGLTEKITWVLSNMDEARKIAGRGREFIKSRLSWESLGNLYEDAYLSVIR